MDVNLSPFSDLCTALMEWGCEKQAADKNGQGTVLEIGSVIKDWTRGTSDNTGKVCLSDNGKRTCRDRVGESPSTNPLYRWWLFTLVIRAPYHFPSFTERQCAKQKGGQSLKDITFSHLSDEGKNNNDQNYHILNATRQRAAINNSIPKVKQSLRWGGYR